MQLKSRKKESINLERKRERKKTLNLFRKLFSILKFELFSIKYFSVLKFGRNLKTHSKK